MTKTMKTILAVALFLSTTAAWPQVEEFPAREAITRAIDPLGTLLEFVGVYRPAELKEQAIVIHRNPLDGSLHYLTVPSKNAGKDKKLSGERDLEITVREDGSVKSVLFKEGNDWVSVPPLETPISKKNQEVIAPGQAKQQVLLPSFEEVPDRRSRSCINGGYQYSEWRVAFGELCLFDLFDCPGLVIGFAACCYGSRSGVPDCGQLLRAP